MDFEQIGANIQEEIENLSFTKVDFDQSIVESKLLDSINLVDLVVFVEEQAGLEIPNSDIQPENFDSINKILNYLKTRV